MLTSVTLQITMISLVEIYFNKNIVILYYFQSHAAWKFHSEKGIVMYRKACELVVPQLPHMRIELSSRLRTGGPGSLVAVLQYGGKDNTTHRAGNHYHSATWILPFSIVMISSFNPVSSTTTINPTFCGMVFNTAMPRLSTHKYCKYCITSCLFLVEKIHLHETVDSA